MEFDSSEFLDVAIKIVALIKTPSTLFFFDLEKNQTPFV